MFAFVDFMPTRLVVSDGCCCVETVIIVIV